MSPPQVVLKPRKAQPFYGRHPWVLDSAIDHTEGLVADGCEVDLISAKGQWIARGLINSQSRIRVRLYSWEQAESLDEAFWRRRIESAVRLRGTLGLDSPRSAVRLIFSEADQLSGLIVDRFGPYLVVQPTARGLADRLELILSLLREVLQPAGMIVRVDDHTRRREGLQTESGHVWGERPEEIVFIEEHGIRYGVELASGQKTGFYLDQRDNRQAAAALMNGRNVLDMCCYTGGFSLAAAILGGASQVLGIDTSEHAVALARANAQLNGVSHVQFRTGDMFQTLEALVAEGARFDGVILDPPKFVRGRAGVRQALQAYHQLNRQALELLEPDGILVTCSCSGNVSSQDFTDMLFGVATRARRNIQVLARRGAAPDHPTLVTCPETEYLKCFICRVE